MRVIRDLLRSCRLKIYGTEQIRRKESKKDKGGAQRALSSLL